MGLPLPSIPNIGAGGNVLSAMKAINDTTKSDLENRYYVPIQGANALSKLAYAQFAAPEAITKFLNLPGVAQVIGPEKYNALVNQVRNTTSQPLANPFAQQQGQSGGGIGGLISGGINKLTNMLGIGNDQGGGASGANALQQGVSFDQNQSNQNQPQGAIPATAGFSNKPGSTFLDPQTGEATSIPTSKQITALQNQISASYRTVPQLQELAGLWKPFMTAGGKAKYLLGRAGNQFGDYSTLPSEYRDAKLAAFAIVESYLKSMGVPVTVEVQSKLNDLIEPENGESETGYKQRLKTETDRIIKDFIRPAIKQLSGGYNVDQRDSSSSPASDIGGGTITLKGGLQVPAEFTSKQARDDWYLAQPSQTQLAYAEYLKDKESTEQKLHKRKK